MKMESLNFFDSYDITTYKWEEIKTKGKSPSPRHSHNSLIIKDHMYVIGGTNSKDLFSKEKTFDDFYVLDLKTFCWTSIITFYNKLFLIKNFLN